MPHQTGIFKAPEIIAKLKENDVIVMRANWTYEDPEIEATIASLGVQSIPLLVLTSKSTQRNPVVIPGPLSAEGFLEHFEKIKLKSTRDR